MRHGATILFILLIAPRIVFGGVVFTEIMYDPEGSDAGHEWVEIYNDGSSPVDISGFKFSEGGTNHGLVVVSGEATLLANRYAIIADDAVKFGIDFPNFSGTVFDSSFSLSNTGETLTLKDKNLSILDTVTYSSSQGASGDGNTIQKNSSGSWVSGTASPGTGLSVVVATNQNTTASSSDNNVSAQSQPGGGGVSSPKIEPQVFADAGKDKIVIVGASVIFEGKAYGLKKEPLENARYVWNFGDGTIKEGKVVEHIYRYPGDYWAVLEVASGYFGGGDRVKVHAEVSPLKISSITDGTAYFVEIYNSSNADVDVSSWWLALGDKNFEIPKNTFVMGGKKLVFGNDVTGLSVGQGSVPELRYPNGMLATKFGETQSLVKPTDAVPEKTEVVSSIKKAKAAVKEISNKSGNVEQIASVINSTKVEKNNNSYIWLSGVVVIVLLALSGLILLRRQENGMRDSDRMAEEIEIIEG